MSNGPRTDREPVTVTTLDEKLITRAMPNGLPWTITKLRSLKPGEEFCFYFGKLDSDIERSAVLAPRYHDLLEAIRQTAEVLEERRRITVTRHYADRRGTIAVEYMATGARLK